MRRSAITVDRVAKRVARRAAATRFVCAGNLDFKSALKKIKNGYYLTSRDFLYKHANLRTILRSPYVIHVTSNNMHYHDPQTGKYESVPFSSSAADGDVEKFVEAFNRYSKPISNAEAAKQESAMLVAGYRDDLSGNIRYVFSREFESHVYRLLGRMESDGTAKYFNKSIRELRKQIDGVRNAIDNLENEFRKF